MASQSRWFPKPDWALAVVFAALVLPAAIPDTAAGLVVGYDNDPFKYRPGTLILLYIVLECARKRHPLTGAAVGAFALALAAPATTVQNAIRQGGGTSLDPGSMLAIAAIGAVLGAVIGSLAWVVEWLVRRKPSKPPALRPEPVKARFSGAMAVMAGAVVLCLLAESVGWAVQAGDGFVNWLSMDILDRMGSAVLIRVWSVVESLVQLDRFVVVVLASLATHAMLKRWRSARALIVAWGLTAFALAVVRVLFFQRLGLPDALGGLTSTSEYTFVNLYMARPALPGPVLFDVMRLEVPIRAALCVVGLPYVLRSKRLKEYLGLPRSGRAATPPDIPDQT